jgi:hypothetical protein
LLADDDLGWSDRGMSNPPAQGPTRWTMVVLSLILLVAAALLAQAVVKNDDVAPPPSPTHLVTP